MNERATFRYTVGLIAILGGLVGLGALFRFEVPPGNRDAVVLALGVVLGWGSSIINGEWGSSPAGREIAKLGVEAHRAAVEQPRQVEVVNPPSHPVPTTDSKPILDLTETAPDDPDEAKP